MMFGKKIIFRQMCIQLIIDYPLKIFCYHRDNQNRTIIGWIVALSFIPWVYTPKKVSEVKEDGDLA